MSGSFKGRIVQARSKTVALPNGREMDMDIVTHPGGAAVVAVDAQNNVCLVHQYRCVLGQWIWELPAGKIDHGEDPLLTAQRELQEETGFCAQRWLSLGSMISSPGVFTERVHLYLAQDLEAGEAHTEPHELLEVHWYPIAELVEWAQGDKIQDAKSVIGILRAATILG